MGSGAKGCLSKKAGQCIERRKAAFLFSLFFLPLFFLSSTLALAFSIYINKLSHVSTQQVPSEIQFRRNKPHLTPPGGSDLDKSNLEHSWVSLEKKNPSRKTLPLQT
jgi:hypothetical protein